MEVSKQIAIDLKLRLDGITFPCFSGDNQHKYTTWYC